MGVETEKSFNALKALLYVGWLAVLLGLTMEAVLVALAAGFGTLKGANPVLADLVQKVSWSTIVCVGLAIGATVKKARGPVMGLAGLFAAPLAFMVARSLHDGAKEALAVAADAGPGPSLILIAILKGFQYGSFGLMLDWVAKKPWGGLSAHLATGLAVGVVFGGTMVALFVQAAPQTPPVPVLVSRTANECLFPIGCALVVYISKILKKLSGRPEE
ncbi:hypothetical protein [Candidatus Methylomirabilis sp.]|uniref:hypothetical protein n=1 Tax=Candidatus Methylomirabilis sp. TaxID=2032687 RepID=UPI002A6527FA|nr:hypothetical protein [Candidatus Methylomirabilis sp.]